MAGGTPHPSSVTWTSTFGAVTLLRFAACFPRALLSTAHWPRWSRTSMPDLRGRRCSARPAVNHPIRAGFLIGLGRVFAASRQQPATRFRKRCTWADARVFLGAVMPAPRWAIGGMTHVVHPRGSRQTSGSLAGLRQCMVVHVSNSGGSRMWQGLLGRRPDWGIGPTRSTGVRKGSPKHTAAPVTGPRFREYFSREARAALREHFR